MNKFLPTQVSVNCGQCGKQFDVPKNMALRKKVSFVCSDCTAPDWTRSCEVCGEKPVHPLTGMCGPCTTGEAATAGGNW